MNSIDKVIASGKIAEPHYSLFQGGFFQFDNIVYTLFFLISVSVLVFNIFKKDKRQIIWSSVVTVIIIASVLIVSFKDYNLAKVTYAKDITIWQDVEAKNYIKGLETKKTEISYFKISEDQPTQSKLWYGNKSFMNGDLLVFSTITYDKDTTVSGWFLINEDLKPNEKPYIEYVEVEKDLGNLIDKGFYNTVVHLPSDYLSKKVQK